MKTPKIFPLTQIFHGGKTEGSTKSTEECKDADVSEIWTFSFFIANFLK